VTSERSLPDKVAAIHRALTDVPHAFGGALALAYWAEPRATVDIDLNVFVPVNSAKRALAPLADLGVETATAESTIAERGQSRVMWGRTPIDLFFAYDPFHSEADRRAVDVPFASGSIRVLSAEHLAVCKVVFNRPKDWIDIDSMLALGTHLDTAEVLRWVGRITGDDDPRYERIAAVLTSRA